MTSGRCLLAAFAFVLLSSSILWAQGSGPNRGGGASGGGRRPPQGSGGPGNKEAKPKPLPNDPKLIAFHRDFVQKVEKLAADYERARQPEKAKICYEEILKLVPEHGPTQQKLNQLTEREATAERKVLDIYANRDWQETGIVLVPGKPIRISASGKWTFNMSHELSPKGMQIPKEMREFDLGALVGVVTGGGKKPQDTKPFLIGEQYEFVAEHPGTLMLRMYDSDVTDNVGKVSVEIQGTFQKQ